MDFVSDTLQQRISTMRQIYLDRHWPEQWLCDILKDFHIWSAHSLRHGGKYAVADNMRGWFEMIFNGRLIRIGRLQYVMDSVFGGRVIVLSKERDIAVFAEDGLTFAEPGWKSTFRKTGDCWEGNRIIRGRPEYEITRLDLKQWHIVLKYGDPMTAIHIPEDGHLTTELCRKSLQQAAEWFSCNIPDWRGFYCQSWMLNPIFQEFLSADSNIVQFQKMGILYPMQSKSDVLDRLYPGTLRDAVLEKQSKGFLFRDGGMFILKNHLEITSINQCREQ